MTATAFDARVDARAPLHPIRALLLAGDHRRKSRAEYEAENPFIEGDIE